MATHLVRPLSYLSIFNNVKLHSILEVGKQTLKLQANSSLVEVQQFAEDYGLLSAAMNSQRRYINEGYLPTIMIPVYDRWTEITSDIKPEELDTTDDAVKHLMWFIRTRQDLESGEMMASFSSMLVEETLRDWVEYLSLEDSLTQRCDVADRDDEWTDEWRTECDEYANSPELATEVKEALRERLEIYVSQWMRQHHAATNNQELFAKEVLLALGWKGKQQLKAAVQTLDVNKEEVLEHQFRFTLKELVQNPIQWTCQVSGREYQGDEVIYLYINNFRMMMKSKSEYRTLQKTVKDIVTDEQWVKLRKLGIRIK